MLKWVAFFCLCWSGATAAGYRAVDTAALVERFHAAWDAQDLAGMESLLADTAFFKSPFQLRYGREEMLTTVLARNPFYYRDLQTEERHSLVKGGMARSLGALTWRVYDQEGNPTDETMHADYTYIFSRDEAGSWLLEALIYHE